MLVRFTDIRGKTRYINAAYVKSLVDKGRRTEIEVSGWNLKFKVDMPADEVAAILNEAMPDLGSMLGSIETEQAIQQAAQAAAAAG